MKGGSVLHQTLIESFKQDPDINKIVRMYSKVQPWKQMSILAFDWGVIGLAVALYLTWPNPWVYICSVLLIASRQHALLIVMHESTHYRFSKKMWLNDGMSDLFAAYPFLISTRLYREYHMPHHRFTNTEQDPDWVKKIPHSEWHFPKTNSGLLRVFGRLALVGGARRIDLMSMLAREDRKKWFYWAAVLALVFHFGVSREFFLLWVVPMLTVFPLLQRLRSISDHFGLERSHEMNSSRNTEVNLIEGFLLSPHNVNFHLTHHLFPGVPCYNLKALHRELMSHSTYARLAHINQSFLFGPSSVWSDLKTIKGHEAGIAERAV